MTNAEVAKRTYTANIPEAGFDFSEVLIIIDPKPGTEASISDLVAKACYIPRKYS